MASFLLCAGYARGNRFPVYQTPLVGTDTRVSQWVTQFHHLDWDRHIDLIESHTELAVDVLTRFHSTVVMNAISAHHFIVMYPQWTFRLLSLAEASDVTPTVLEKYQARGVQFLYDNSHMMTKCRRACPSLVRGIGHPGTVMYAPYALTHLRVPPVEFPSWKTWRAPFTCKNAACSRCISVRTIKLWSTRPTDPLTLARHLPLTPVWLATGELCL